MTPPPPTMYIVMRYVQGSDLRNVLLGEGRLLLDRAAEVIGQVAAALDAAHSEGLVHRDVKPANVLLEAREGREHAYLSDFGLTKRLASTSGVTRTGEWLGTLDYAAPEQIRGGRLDARSDVYSLGCLLYQALNGSVVFPRDSDVAKIFAHVNDDPPAIAASKVPDALNGVILRALAKDPEERFPSAGDLGRAVRAAIEGGAPTRPEHSVAVGAAAPNGRTAPSAGPEGSTSPQAPTRIETQRKRFWPGPHHRVTLS